MALLNELVSRPSVVGTSGEADFADFLYERIHPDPYPVECFIIPVDADGKRKSLLYYKPGKRSRRALLFLGHYDTVDVKDYGRYEHLAFSPSALRRALKKERRILPEDGKDLEDKRYLFGRGSLDMKAGIALLISILHWSAPLSAPFLFFGFVPDEEGNSAGIRALLPVLKEVLDAHRLQLVAVVKADFTTTPGAIYTGSTGKLLVNLLIRGIPTHASSPRGGISAVSLLSECVCLLERIKIDGKPVVCLRMRDLQEGYSVQTPELAWAYFNVFFHRRHPEAILWGIEQAISPVFTRAGIPLKTFSPLRFRGRERTSEPGPSASPGVGDARQQSLNQALKQMEQPGGILFFSPPFYPPVHQSLATAPSFRFSLLNAVEETQSRTGQTFRFYPYYPHISDLSFIQPSMEVWSSFQSHCPVFFPPPPLLSRQPVLVVDIGPCGKAPHQWLERVDTHYSLNILPILYKKIIENFAKE